MTDAHAKAVEAAVIAHWGDCYTNNPRLQNDFEKDMAAAITAYLAAMRAAGWVMVRLEDNPRALSAEEWTLRMRDAVAKGAGDGQG